MGFTGRSSAGHNRKQPAPNRRAEIALPPPARPPICRQGSEYPRNAARTHRPAAGTVTLSTALGFTSGVTRDNFWLEQCGDLADGVVFPRKQTAPYSPGPRAAPRNRYETWSQLTHGGSNGSERASSADTQRHAPGTSGTGTEPAAQRALFACSSFWVSSKTPGWRRAPR